MFKRKLQIIESVLLLVIGITGVLESKRPLPPLIEKLSCEKNTVNVGINRSFKEAYLKGDFFAEYDKDINLEAMPYEIVTMPFICNVISIIWISGKKYSIPSMDEDLYYSFKRIKKIFQVSYPKTSWDGELIPEKLVPFSKRFRNASNKKTKRALLFSGGLDSTSSLIAHRNEKLLLITAWGQYDTPLKEETAWEERKKRSIEAAQQYGHKNTFIKSNYAQFFKWKVLNALSPEIENWRISAVDGIGWAGLVAPIFFAKKRSALYIASSNCWYYPYIDCINPFVDTSMHFAAYRLIHDQFDYTRLDKGVFVAHTCEKHNLKKPYIKVCQRTKLLGDVNCCNCKKCLLTILSLWVGGADPRDYGFPTTLETTLRRSLEHLHNKSNDYETLWNFIDIQRALKSRVAQRHYDKALSALLKPFLRLDLTKVRVKHRKFLSRLRIDWNDLTKLVPSVVMPSDLPDAKWEVERIASTLLKGGKRRGA